MSLKFFHICFIIISVMLTAGFGLWALLANGLPTAFRVMGGISLVGGLVLIIYGIRFLRKAKSIIM